MVGEPPREREQAADGEGVRVDRPLERRTGGVQIDLDARQRQDDDQVVHADHDQAEKQNAENLPATLMSGSRVHGSHGSSLLTFSTGVGPEWTYQK
jgi:hypothetical protein